MSAVLDSLLEHRPTGRQSLRLRQLLRIQRSLPRRQGRRLELSQRVRYRLDNGPFRGAQLQDIGPSGLRLVLPQRVKEGCRLQVLYQRQGGDHWVEGEVRWSRKLRWQHEVGVELEFRSEHDRGPFEKLVQELDSVPVPPIPPQPAMSSDEPWYLDLLQC